MVLGWNPIQRIRGSASHWPAPYVFRGSVIPLIWTALIVNQPHHEPARGLDRVEHCHIFLRHTSPGRFPADTPWRTKSRSPDYGDLGGNAQDLGRVCAGFFPRRTLPFEPSVCIIYLVGHTFATSFHEFISKSCCGSGTAPPT